MNGKGFYVMGKYTSMAWFLKKEDAEKEVKRLISSGAWYGMKPYVLTVGEKEKKENS